MSIRDVFVDGIIRHAKQTPYFHLKGYMGRWWFLRVGKRTADGNPSLLGAKVHHIVRSDDDRACHCHPWPYITWLMRGSYMEIREYEVPLSEGTAYSAIDEVCKQAEKRGEKILWVRYRNSASSTKPITGVIQTIKKIPQGSVLFRRSTDRHRLVVSEHQRQHGGVWTLFITFKKVKSWGFYTDAGFINWRDYPASAENNLGVTSTEWPE